MTLKQAIYVLLKRDYVIGTGTTSTDWVWRKYASGRYEAEKVWNVGQVTLSTSPATNYRVSQDITLSQVPSVMISGSVQATLQGSSSGSPIFLENISSTKVRIAKITSGTVTLQNVTIILRTVNGRWK